MECEVNKTQLSSTGQSLNIEWFKKNAIGVEEKINENDKRIDAMKLNKKLILKIKDATVDDAGIYVLSIGSVKAEAKLTVKEIPITFKKPLEDQRAKEGQNCTFECTVNRSDKPVTWLINGVPITKDDIKSGKYTIKQEKNRLQLTINDLDLEKDNNCEVTCKVGEKAKSSAKLRVDEDEIKFVERLVDLGVRENEPAQFVCKLSKLDYKNKPGQTLNIKWFVNGKEIDNNKLNEENSRYSIQQISTTLKLNISAVHPEDAGEIKCQINDGIYTAAQLSVEEEPVIFVKKLTDITCNDVPGKVCFSCELNKPFVKAKWYRNGKEISPDDSKYDFGREGCKHFLYIKDVNGQDEGEYSIILQDKSEKKCMGILTVKAGPKLFLNAKYKDTITIKNGKPLILEVDYSAYPEPKASWMLNDETIKESARIKLESIKNKLSTLVVNKTQRSDSGKYHLTLENEYGREKCTITVNVLDKPSPPRNPKVSDVSGKDLFI